MRRRPRFSWRRRLSLGVADGTILSTKVAGGFVATYLGMYARMDATHAGNR